MYQEIHHLSINQMIKPSNKQINQSIQASIDWLASCLTSDHCPNFWLVLVKVMLGVMVELITALVPSTEIILNMYQSFNQSIN